MARKRSFALPAIDGIRAAYKPALHDRAKIHHYRQRIKRTILGLLGIAAITIGLVLVLKQPYELARSVQPLWQPGTYLVLFENDAELRPAGGFIGSYAVVHIHANRTIDYRIETNVYKDDNAYAALHPIDPPAPLKGIVPHWTLRDSNWDIDFAQAAATVLSFYHEETGDTADGVVAVTGQAARGLLDILGPATLSDGTKLTSENFYNTLAYKIEKEYFVDPNNRAMNEPKALLTGLIPQLAHQLWLPWNDLRVAAWAQQMLETKQILLSFVDGRQHIVDDYGWGDRINSTTQHYLSLNNANLAGLKSSQHMSQTVQLAITQHDPNRVTYELTVVRTHHGTGAWPDHRNDNLTRIVLPIDATLTSATVADVSVQPASIEQDEKRTAIGFRMDTESGTSLKLVATFSVPIDTTLAPQFVWQKQPGVANDTVTITKNGAMILKGIIDRDATVSLQ